MNDWWVSSKCLHHKLDATFGTASYGLHFLVQIFECFKCRLRVVTIVKQFSYFRREPGEQVSFFEWMSMCHTQRGFIYYVSTTANVFKDVKTYKHLLDFL